MDGDQGKSRGRDVLALSFKKNAKSKTKLRHCPGSEIPKLSKIIVELVQVRVLKQHFLSEVCCEK